MSDSNYIAKTTEDLFSKIDLIQGYVTTNG